MGTTRNRGFTIIETVLVLGITGLMAIGVLATSSISINASRYKDSVTSLQSFIQQQYVQTTSVTNDRMGSEACSSGGVSNSGIPVPRGQSDCLILGRYVTSSDGIHLTAWTVIGYPSNGASSTPPNDLTALQQYDLSLSPLEPSTTSVKWGDSIVAAKTTKPLSFAVLIARSPFSGNTLTFTSSGSASYPDTGNAALNKLMTSQAVGPSSPLNLCIDPQGTSVAGITGNRLGVQISVDATNQSAVLIPAQSEGICG